jgi:hypothetical protein
MVDEAAAGAAEFSDPQSIFLMRRESTWEANFTGLLPND